MAMYNSRMPSRRHHNRLTPQEDEIIKVSFREFSEEQEYEDQYGNKEKKLYITTDKLREAFRAIDAEGDIHDIQLLIDDIDENGDGMIDEKEWEQIMMRKFLGEDDDSSSVHIFSMLDDNKDGFIPLVEMRSILMREGQAPLSEQEVDELLMFADRDSDGLIDYRKFLEWLSNPGPKKNRFQQAAEEKESAAAKAALAQQQAQLPQQRPGAAGRVVRPDAPPAAAAGSPDTGAGTGLDLEPAQASPAQAGSPPQQQAPPRAGGGFGGLGARPAPGPPGGGPAAAPPAGGAGRAPPANRAPGVRAPGATNRRVPGATNTRAPGATTPGARPQGAV